MYSHKSNFIDVFFGQFNCTALNATNRIHLNTLNVKKNQLFVRTQLRNWLIHIQQSYARI